jgi:2'-5' RNA ligase
MKRVFLAMDISPDSSFIKELESIRYELHDGHIKWVNTQNLHLTLRFFGDMEERVISHISELISEAVSGCKTFLLTMDSLGVFKSLREPRVIWIGCNIPEEFAGLKKAIDRKLEQIDMQSDKREFSPHLTLGRIKDLPAAGELLKLIERYRGFIFSRQIIENIILYESILKPSGPVYFPLRVFELKKDE